MYILRTARKVTPPATLDKVCWIDEDYCGHFTKSSMRLIRKSSWIINVSNWSCMIKRFQWSTGGRILTGAGGPQNSRGRGWPLRFGPGVVNLAGAGAPVDHWAFYLLYYYLLNVENKIHGIRQIFRIRSMFIYQLCKSIIMYIVYLSLTLSCSLLLYRVLFCLYRSWFRGLIFGAGTI